MHSLGHITAISDNSIMVEKIIQKKLGGKTKITVRLAQPQLVCDTNIEVSFRVSTDSRWIVHRNSMAKVQSLNQLSQPKQKQIYRLIFPYSFRDVLKVLVFCYFILYYSI